MQDMNRKIGVGVLWNLLSMFLTRGATTIFTLLLARFLAPDAFGLVAMSMVVFEVATVFITSGLGTALIRSKEVCEADLNTVFYSNLGLSVLAYIALFGGAPYIAEFYDQPELTTLVRVMGLVVFINATKIVQGAILSRKMDFKLQMKGNTAGVLVSGTLAVGAAWNGFGVWSLVIQMLSAALVSGIVLWLGTGWRPRLQFSRESFKRLFGFGKAILAEGILDKLFQNSYVLVIGRFFGAELTGLYYFGRKFSNLISRQLTGAVQRATLPALSTLQDDNVHLKRKFRQVMQLMMAVIVPIMAILAGVSQTLFSLLFDERWQGAVPFIQVLCLVGMLYPLHSLNVNLLNVKGRSDLILKIGVFKKVVNLTLLFCAIPFGVFGIVVSQLIASILSLAPNTYYSEKLVGYTLSEQLSDIWKPILSSIFAGGSAWLVSQAGQNAEWVWFILGGCSGLFVYFIVSIIVRMEAVYLLASRMPLWRRT
ncbi:lipopolysaccharide biosynthesis protein [Marinobacter sp. DUT-1]|uniref:lipopolysaccharide biosynthesis protein n=1 Tax=Marinobacter sp. DUT-1 TaxID=3412037 RepID=UPI003D180410